MKVMGIDASSKITGVAIFDGKLKYWNAINLSYIKDYDTRSGDMMREIGKEIEKHNPDVVYIEDTFEKQGGFHNAATMKKLCYIIGGVRYACISHDVPFNLILPSEWRKLVGISKGGVERETFKERALAYVKERYGVTDITDDVADAICIAEAGYITNDDLFE